MRQLRHGTATGDSRHIGATRAASTDWLRQDLRTHHQALSFAFFRFPLYAGTATRERTTSYTGAATSSFLLVTVDGRTVSVAPTNANGHRFDARTYRFG